MDVSRIVWYSVVDVSTLPATAANCSGMIGRQIGLVEGVDLWGNGIFPCVTKRPKYI